MITWLSLKCQSLSNVYYACSPAHRNMCMWAQACWCKNKITFLLSSPLQSQVDLVVKNLPANAGDITDLGSVPGLGRPSGGGNGNLLQYSCLENPRDRGASQATFLRVAKSRTKWSDLGCTYSLQSPFTWIMWNVSTGPYLSSNTLLLLWPKPRAWRGKQFT